MKKSELRQIIREEISNILNKLKINEISPDTFKSAIDVSKERNTDKRTYKLGQLYFNKFIGKELMGGEITDIGVYSPQQGNYKVVTITVKYIYPNAIKHNRIQYDINDDIYNIEQEIDRRDAVVLSKIAQHVNPDTKYKETGKHFKIRGW